MYLLVFITLVISLIGIYAQVLSLQTARLASSQVAVAQEMLRWHSTAVAQVRYGQPTLLAAGCSLSSPSALAGFGFCNNAGLGLVNVSLTKPGAWNACSGSQAAPCWTTLPPGYKTAPYTFYSVYYQPAGKPPYIVTFVQPPTVTAANPAPGFITLPGIGGTQIGVTLSDLDAQIKNDHLGYVSYGTFNGANLVTPPVGSVVGGATASFSYPLPATLTAAAYNGSVGVISTP